MDSLLMGSQASIISRMRVREVSVGQETASPLDTLATSQRWRTDSRLLYPMTEQLGAQGQGKLALTSFPD